MTVIPEEKLIELLRTCLELSQVALGEIQADRGTKPCQEELLANYQSFIQDLHAQKSEDLTLADESWEWIWKVKPDLSPLQAYGRLAFINYTLLDLL